MKNDLKWGWPRWPYLILAFATAAIPYVHHKGLDAAFEKLRYPWGLMYGDALIVRNCGEVAMLVSGCLLVAFVYSLFVETLRNDRIVAYISVATSLFLGWYGFWCAVELSIQLKGK
jgi:hypothetical protein